MTELRSSLVKKHETTMQFDPVSFALGIIGSFVAIGAIVLSTPHRITALIGVSLLLLANSNMLGIKFTIKGVTGGAVVAWALLLIAYGVFQFVAVLHAVVVMLGG